MADTSSNKQNDEDIENIVSEILTTTTIPQNLCEKFEKKCSTLSKEESVLTFCLPLFFSSIYFLNMMNKFVV